MSKRYSVGIYEDQVRQMIGENEDTKRSFPTWATVLLVLVALAGTAAVGFLIYKLVKGPSHQENYQYLHHILKKDCILTLPDYITLLDDTTNTQSISLQELCQNWTCNVENVDQTNVSNMITTVAKPAIAKCIKNQDWLRLALINLKIYNIMNMFDKSYQAERALTNGVYGVEYIIIPKEDLVKIIDTTPHLDVKSAVYFSKKNGFNKEDEDALVEYATFMTNVAKEEPLIKKTIMGCDKIDPFLFAVMSTISIGYAIFTKKSGC